MTTTIAFFNNKGGVGKTPRAWLLAYLFADLGHRVLLFDPDPQSALTAMCLPEEMLEEIWPDAPQAPPEPLDLGRPRPRHEPKKRRGPRNGPRGPGRLGTSCWSG
jgi:hypothetical protein